MCMLALGAKGETLNQIQVALGCNHEDNKKVLEALRLYQNTVNVTNAVFPVKGARLSTEFENNLQSYYWAKALPQPFETQPEQARGNINQFVENNTNGLIKQLLPQGSIESDTRIVLVNTIYFKGKWEYPFKKEHTQPMSFATLGGGNTQVQMMTDRKSRTHKWIDYGSGVEGLILPFNVEGFDMVFVKPSGGNTASSLEKAEQLALVNAGRERTDMFNLVQIPKFTLSKTLELSRSFQQLGITDAFTRRADFSRMFADSTRDLFVSGVFHQAKIIVNEEGAEAAAATGIVVSRTSAMPEPRKQFVLDRSFVALIRFRGQPLFVSRVIEPKTE